MTAPLDIDLIKQAMKGLSKKDKQELDDLLTTGTPEWVPLPGPQTEAYYCMADELFYGGAAGGGKTDLLLGLTLTCHQKSIIFRRESPQLQGIIDRMTELQGGREGYNGQEKIWRLPGKQIELGSCPHLGNEIRYQGRPHSLKGFDEITHFLEAQFRFLCGWLRTVTPNERQRIVATGNPPTTPEGEWVREYWAPWLMEEHANPAKYGELRFFATIDGKDEMLENGEPFEYEGEMVEPKSRTFIPSSIEDNPFLMETGYKSRLQALPEPLRSQMLKGSFTAGMDDDPWQVIPTSWVKAAQDRWQPRENPGVMDSMGIDPARGGADNLSISRRHGTWFAPMERIPGEEVPDGPTAAARTIALRRDKAPVHIDVIGVGTSPTDFLVSNNIQTIAVNNSAKSFGMDRTHQLKFVNIRAETQWGLREALDPITGDNLALPPDPRLRADLCTPRWMLKPGGIQVETKEEIKKRIGRSPDDGDAVVLANITTVKDEVNPFNATRPTYVTHNSRDYDPYA